MIHVHGRAIAECDEIDVSIGSLHQRHKFVKTLIKHHLRWSRTTANYSSNKKYSGNSCKWHNTSYNDKTPRSNSNDERIRGAIALMKTYVTDYFIEDL